MMELKDIVFQELLGDIASERLKGDINLSHNYFSFTYEQIIALMQAIKHNTSITLLNLSSNRINYEVANAIAQEIPSSSLTDLNFGNNNIKYEGAKALAKVLLSSNLTNLDLRGNNIGYEGASAIAKELSGSKLIYLNLNLNYICNKGAKAIAEALPGSSITDLNLGYNYIGCEGTLAIAEALPTSGLTSLYLSNNILCNEGVKIIAKALLISNLITLNLSHNLIGNKGAAAIAKALPSSSLTDLNLSENEIKNKGAVAIAKLLPSSRLIVLNLEHCAIEYQGIKALIQAAKGAVVTYLSLPLSFLSYSPYDTLYNIQTGELTTLLQNTNITYMCAQYSGIEFIDYACHNNEAKIRQLFHVDLLPMKLQTQEFYKKIYKSGFLVKAIEELLISLEKVHELILKQLEQSDDIQTIDLEGIKDSIILDLICSENLENKSAFLNKIAQSNHQYNFNVQACLADLINEGWYKLSEEIIIILDIKNCCKFLPSILLLPHYNNLSELVLDHIPDKNINITYINSAALYPNGSKIFNAMLYKDFCIGDNIQQTLETVDTNDPWGYFRERVHSLKHYKQDPSSFCELYERIKANREYEEALYAVYENSYDATTTMLAGETDQTTYTNGE